MSNPYQQIAHHVNELLDENSEIGDVEAYHKSRAHFKRLPGDVQKEEYLVLFEQVKKLHGIPLLRSVRKLAALEDALVKDVIDEIQQSATEDPARIRELIGICTKIKSNTIQNIDLCGPYVEDGTWDRVLEIFPDRTVK